MSESRHETVEVFVNAWNSRDLGPVLARAGDDFEYVNAPNSVEPGTRTGSKGIETVMRKQWEALGDDARLEVTRFHDRDNHVITEGNLSRSMPGSTTRLDNKALIRWTFRNERIVGLEILGAGSTYTEALEAAGLAKSS